MALKFEFGRYTYGAYLSGTGLSSADMVKEYTRLSRQANRNLERIMRSEFASDQYFRKYKQGFPSAAELTESQLAHELQEVARFTSGSHRSYSALRETRREAVRSLKEHGYTGITYRNFPDFAAFMDAVKGAYNDGQYDSERAVEAFEANEKKRRNKVSPEQLAEDFRNWQESERIV